LEVLAPVEPEALAPAEPEASIFGVAPAVGFARPGVDVAPGVVVVVVVVDAPGVTTTVPLEVDCANATLEAARKVVAISKLRTFFIGILSVV
jgi:hypothetical protein